MGCLAAVSSSEEPPRGVPARMGHAVVGALQASAGRSAPDLRSRGAGRVSDPRRLTQAGPNQQRGPPVLAALARVGPRR